ncbi:MAG: DUF1580 domain-containing protein [Planctomycetota bacterium]|nr:MAG: DUF1580 domain-containing protein [Planctomycetota bacterium]
MSNSPQETRPPAISLEEQLLPLAQAAKLLPGRRHGRPPAPSTLYRWACYGLSGVRLEVVQVGGTMCTSRAALERFFTRLAAARPPAKAGEDG